MVENIPLGQKLGMIGHVMQLEAGKILHKECDLALNSYIILHKTHLQGKINQQELANKLQLTTAAISKRIKVLIEKKLIIATINEDNRREHCITLTPLGKKTHDKADEVLKLAFENMTKEFKEKKELNELLNKLLPVICGDKNDHRSCKTPN